MEKIKKIGLLMMVFIIPIMLIGCSSAKEEKNIVEEKSFGSYEVLNGWIQEKTHSTEDVTFYVKEGTENDNPPNNIAVSEGKNQFKESEHEKFKAAIMAQVNAQMPEDSDVKIDMEGKTTENKNKVYIITIKEKNMETKFYYIVGDYRFVMIQASSFDNSNQIYKVSDHIADSFVWKDK